MGLRRAILEEVFKVKTTQGMFSDVLNQYCANVAAAAYTPTRKGQIMWGSSGGTNKVFLAIAATGTKTSAWIDLTP